LLFQPGSDSVDLTAEPAEDGETLIQRKSNCVHGTGSLRFAMFLHLYDPDRPRQWQAGVVTCPPIQDIHLRLALLMPYRACNLFYGDLAR
jgi:hypothetical protein